MKSAIKYERFCAFSVGAFVLLMLPAVVAAQSGGKQHGQAKPHTVVDVLKSAEEFASIIRSPNQSITLAQLRNLLPPKITIDQPSWIEGDMATGNAAELKGEILGLVVFLNQEQRSALKSDSLLTEEQ